MFCGKCGAELPAEAQYCGVCGEQAPVSTNPQHDEMPAPAPAPANAGAGTSTAGNTYPHPYHKLGGWLLLCVVMFWIGGAGGVVAGIQVLLHASALSALTTIEGVGAAVASLTVYGIATIAYGGAYMVVPHSIQQRSPRFLNYYVILAIVSAVLFLVLGTLLGLSAASVVGSLLGSVVACIVWTAYFSKSVRVRTYMGSDEYLRRCFVTKNMSSPEPADTKPYSE